jgi:hypothetical protein
MVSMFHVNKEAHENDNLNIALKYNSDKPFGIDYFLYNNWLFQ